MDKINQEDYNSRTVIAGFILEIAAVTKLTNKLIAYLYLEFDKDYREWKNGSPTPPATELYNKLYDKLSYSLNDPDNVLSELSGEDKNNAYKVLNTFFYLHSDQDKESIQKHFYLITRTSVYVISHPDNGPYCNLYHPHESILTDLLIWDMLSWHHHCPQHPSCFDTKYDEKDGASLALVVFFAIGCFASVYALYYLLKQSIDNTERFIFNEGWLQASVIFASIIAGAVIGAALGAFVVSALIVSLATTAGITSPFILVTAGTVISSILSAAAACKLADMSQDYYMEGAHEESFDSQDPHRFILTDAEKEHLLAKNIDPVMVVCALVELRMQLRELPPLSAKLFGEGRTEKQEELLRTIRQLRNGELGDSLKLAMSADKTLYLGKENYSKAPAPSAPPEYQMSAS